MAFTCTPACTPSPYIPSFVTPDWTPSTMVTVTTLLRASKTNSDGTASIYLRISDRDKTRFVSLGVRIRPKDWLEKDQRVSKRHKHSDDINALIRRNVEELEEEMYRRKAGGEEPTADELKGVLGGRPRQADFFEYADQIVEEMRRRGQIPASKR